MSAHKSLAEAATRLRSLSRPVDPDPRSDVRGVIPGPWRARDAYVETVDGEWDFVAHCAGFEEAALVAAFGPDVATALADVLDDAARQLYPSDLLVALAARINARTPAAVTA